MTLCPVYMSYVLADGLTPITGIVLEPTLDKTTCYSSSTKVWLVKKQNRVDANQTSRLATWPIQYRNYTPVKHVEMSVLCRCCHMRIAHCRQRKPGAKHMFLSHPLWKDFVNRFFFVSFTLMICFVLTVALGCCPQTSRRH